MGRTPKPLTIIALPPCDTWQELEQLEAQGHIIRRVTKESKAVEAVNLFEADLVIGETAWHLTQKHRRYLTDAIYQSRLRKYGEPSPAKRKKVKKDESVDQSIDEPDDSDGELSS